MPQVHLEHPIQATCTHAHSTHAHTHTHTHTLADQSSRGLLFVLGLLVPVFYFVIITSQHRPTMKQRLLEGINLGGHRRYVKKASLLHITANLDGLCYAAQSRNARCPPADMTAETVNPTSLGTGVVHTHNRLNRQTVFSAGQNSQVVYWQVVLEATAEDCPNDMTCHPRLDCKC